MFRFTPLFNVASETKVKQMVKYGCHTIVKHIVIT